MGTAAMRHLRPLPTAPAPPAPLPRAAWAAYQQELFDAYLVSRRATVSPSAVHGTLSALRANFLPWLAAHDRHVWEVTPADLGAWALALRNTIMTRTHQQYFAQVACFYDWLVARKADELWERLGVQVRHPRRPLQPRAAHTRGRAPRAGPARGGDHLLPRRQPRPDRRRAVGRQVAPSLSRPRDLAGAQLGGVAPFGTGRAGPRRHRPGGGPPPRRRGQVRQGAAGPPAAAAGPHPPLVPARRPPAGAAGLARHDPLPQSDGAGLPPRQPAQPPPRGAGPGRAAGRGALPCHGFRRAYATRLYKALRRQAFRDPLIYVKEQLGHAYLSTTQRYCQLDDDYRHFLVRDAAAALAAH